MGLTPSQRQTLKTVIAADSILAASVPGSDGDLKIAAALDQQAVPDFFVWESRLGTAFVAAEIVRYDETDALAEGKRWSWAELRQTGELDCGSAAVRKAVSDIFGALPNTWTALQAAMRRRATRAEKLFANLQPGDGSAASPAKLRLVGALDVEDVRRAREE